MSYETITTVSNILNSKNGPLYAGMASIVVFNICHNLTKKNKNNYGSYGKKTKCNTTEHF